MVDTIIFDNEGVIVDTEFIWDKEQEEFLGRRGIKYRKNEIKHLLSGKSIIEGVRILKQKYNLAGEESKLSNERLSIVKDLLRTNVSFIEGFLGFYEIVRHKFKICVATSMNEELLNIIDKKLFLSKLFNGRVYSLKYVRYRSKPDPDIFLYAAKELKSRPENCLVIEDSPNGIDAACKAGMKSIGLATTYTGERLKKANLIVNSFYEIDIDKLHLI